MTIDITPEAVELLAHCCNELGYKECATTLRALSAALTASKAETASAYELVAVKLSSNIPPSLAAYVQQSIRALAPADSKAALDRMIAEARKPYEEAYQYALNLADCVMGKHYHDNKDWRPEGDLMGLLTQIDNMVAGVASKARADGMREAAAIADSKYAKGEMGNPGHHILAAIPKGKDHE